MFHADISFVLALIALVSGMFLIVFAKAHKEISTGFYKFIGIVVVILSIVVLLCSGYCTVKGYAMRSKIMVNMMQGKTMSIMHRHMHKAYKKRYK